MSARTRRAVVRKYTQSKIAQPTKRQAAMTAGKAPPAIVQHMMGCLSADINSYQGLLRRALLWLAPSNKIWSWPSHRVLHNVREAGRKHDADGKTEDCDIGFMHNGLEY